MRLFVNLNGGGGEHIFQWALHFLVTEIHSVPHIREGVLVRLLTSRLEGFIFKAPDSTRIVALFQEILGQRKLTDGKYLAKGFLRKARVN